MATVQASLCRDLGEKWAVRPVGGRVGVALAVIVLEVLKGGW